MNDQTIFEQYPIDVMYLTFKEKDRFIDYFYSEVIRISNYHEVAVYTTDYGIGFLRAINGTKEFVARNNNLCKTETTPYIGADVIEKINKYNIIEVWENGVKTFSKKYKGEVK